MTVTATLREARAMTTPASTVTTTATSSVGSVSASTGRTAETDTGADSASVQVTGLRRPAGRGRTRTSAAAGESVSVGSASVRRETEISTSTGSSVSVTTSTVTGTVTARSVGTTGCVTAESASARLAGRARPVTVNSLCRSVWPRGPARTDRTGGCAVDTGYVSAGVVTVMTGGRENTVTTVPPVWTLVTSSPPVWSVSSGARGSCWTTGTPTPTLQPLTALRLAWRHASSPL